MTNSTRRALSIFFVWGLLYGPKPSAIAQQQGSEEPALSYEGETVSSIEFAGQPDPQKLPTESLILQPANAPYSQQKIDATLASIKQTGSFQDVKLNVAPESKGLRVLLVLEPAFYFGVFEFPEAVKKFSYSRLLQASSYSRQDPYTSNRVDEAKSNVLEFLHQNGYFLATVEPSLQTDPAHRVVNVIFQTQLKQHARFGAIRVTGASESVNARLQRALRSLSARLRGASLKTGRPYSYKRLQKATDQLKRELGKQHYLAGTVQMLPPQYDPKTNRAEVTFHVVTGEVTEVKVIGGRISDRTKKRIIPIYEENAVDPDLIHEGEDDLKAYFQSKGYFDTKITSRIEQHAYGQTVIYEVDKGRRGKVRAVEFQGNRSFSDKDLRSRVAVARARWWLPYFSRGKFSSKLVSTSTKRIESAYRAAGYSEVKVTPQVMHSGGDVRVRFQVDEGVRDVVANLQLQGNKALSEFDLAPKGLKLETGRPYSQQLLQKDRDQILATYFQKGFLTVAFRAKVERPKDDPHHVRVVYLIQEGPQVYASNVVPVGARKTRADTVKTNADIKSGKPLSQTSLLQAESQLLGLGVFDWASVDTREPLTNQSQEDVLVKVHESKRNTISYGGGFEVTNRGGKVPSGTVALPGLPPVGLPSNFVTSEKTFWGPRGSIEYTRTNLFGLAETLSLNALAGRLDQRGSASWLDPSFWNSVWTSLVTISAERSSQNPIFTSRQGQASIQFQRNLDAQRTKLLFIRYRFSRTTLSNLLTPDLVLPEDRNVRLSTLSASYSRDTRDNFLDAHKGIYQSIEIDLSPHALGSNTSFARASGQMSYYKKLFGTDVVWANSLRLGVELAFSGAHIPVSETFFSGGGSSLRGFPLNGAGPQRAVVVCGNPNDASTCGKISVPVGGPQLVILNSELRFPLKIMKNLGGAVFYDGGNVFRSVGFGDFGSQYTSSIGGGFRYNTPLGPIRLDIGHLINTVPGVKSTQVFISLGQAF